VVALSVCAARDCDTAVVLAAARGGLVRRREPRGPALCAQAAAVYCSRLAVVEAAQIGNRARQPNESPRRSNKAVHRSPAATTIKTCPPRPTTSMRVLTAASIGRRASGCIPGPSIFSGVTQMRRSYRHDHRGSRLPAERPQPSQTEDRLPSTGPGKSPMITGSDEPAEPAWAKQQDPAGQRAPRTRARDPRAARTAPRRASRRRIAPTLWVQHPHRRWRGQGSWRTAAVSFGAIFIST